MRKIIPVLIILASAATALCKAPDIYTDPINGFSFQPPADGFQTVPNEKLYLARWMKNDPKTQKTIWALTVNRWIASMEDKDKKTLTEKQYADLKLKVFQAILAADLKTNPKMKIKSNKIVKVGQKMGIEICGTIEQETYSDAGLTVDKKTVKRCFYQVSIRTEPRMFITFRMVAQEDQKAQAQKLWQTMLGTIRTFDPKKQIEKQRKMMHNAEKILENVSENGFENAFDKKTLWFMVLKDSKPIGWFSSKSFRKKFDNRTGTQINTCARIEPQSDKEVVRLVYQSIFLSDDMDYERWLMRMQIGSGPTAELIVEKGLRQQDLIFCNTHTPGVGMQRHQTLIPKPVKTIYMPKAIGAVAPAIINLQADQNYTFAEYSSNKNDFVMREINVIGPEDARVMGKFHRLIHLRDRSHRNKQPADVWVDAKGKLIKTRAANGIVMEACTEKDILGKFPDAIKTIKVMRKASMTTRKASKNDAKQQWMGDM